MNLHLLAKVMPFVMGVEASIASIAYLFSRDLKFGLYWGFAACINFTLAIL